METTILAMKAVQTAEDLSPVISLPLSRPAASYSNGGCSTDPPNPDNPTPPKQLNPNPLYPNPMVDFEPLIALLMIAAIVGVFVKYIKLPYTIALVIAGLAIGFAGIDLGIELSADLIFLVFLPPLLFEAAISLDIAHIKDNIRTIVLLAIPGVIVSTLIVGAVLHYVMALPLGVALLFGAIISPTDPVSVVALFKQLGAPKRLSTIVEGESLFNDGTGVVIFAVMLLLIQEGRFTILDGSIEFVKEVAGGLVIGGAFGFLAFHVSKPINDYLVEVMISVILVFGAFILGNLIGVSGIVAVVVAGVIIGNYAASESMSPTTRLTLISFWEFVAFVVNSVLFVLIGLEIHLILPGSVGLGLAVLASAVGIAAMLLARAIVVYGGLAILKRWGERIPANWKHVIFWGGLRGSIPVALALGLTVSVVADAALLKVMTFGVVLFSLVVGGLTMKPLMKHWGFFPQKEVRDRYESSVGRAISIEAAREELRCMLVAGEISDGMYASLEADLDQEFSETKKEISALADEHEWLQNQQMQRARKRILHARRAAIKRARTGGIISDDSAKQVVEEIDKAIERIE